ncbi:hypothetical protein Vadar_000844 [Vaccinium darrowii]|uniref:Uncharacterized protein n=1 Tax=Vaccinium darrowii TaxID=229202 RepID=A0ACB7XX30_9ERIC|nr:hypothetical protein Vadar_000844 [Vaccinium darrowii]
MTVPEEGTTTQYRRNMKTYENWVKKDHHVRFTMSLSDETWEYFKLTMMHNEMVKTFNDLGCHLELEAERQEARRGNEAFMVQPGQCKTNGSKRKRQGGKAKQEQAGHNAPKERTKNTGGMLGTKLKVVGRPKADDVSPTREKCVPVEGLRSSRKNAGDAALRAATVGKDSVQAISRKRKNSAGDVTEITESKVEDDSSVVVENTLNKGGGKAIPKKRTKPTGNVTLDKGPKVERDDRLVVGDTINQSTIFAVGTSFTFLARQLLLHGLRIRLYKEVGELAKISLLIGVCIWLVYQVQHSNNKKASLERSAKVSEKVGNDILKLGRKDLDSQAEEITIQDQRHKEKEEDGENKHFGEESKIDEGQTEGKGVTNDEMHDHNPDQLGDESENRGNFVDTEKETETSTGNDKREETSEKESKEEENDRGKREEGEQKDMKDEETEESKEKQNEQNESEGREIKEEETEESKEKQGEESEKVKDETGSVEKESEERGESKDNGSEETKEENEQRENKEESRGTESEEKEREDNKEAVDIDGKERENEKAEKEENTENSGRSEDQVNDGIKEGTGGEDHIEEGSSIEEVKDSQNMDSNENRGLENSNVSQQSQNKEQNESENTTDKSDVSTENQNDLGSDLKETNSNEEQQLQNKEQNESENNTDKTEVSNENQNNSGSDLQESKTIEKNNSSDVMVDKGIGNDTIVTNTDEHQQEDKGSIASSGENSSLAQEDGVSRESDFTQHQGETTTDAGSKGDGSQTVLEEQTETKDEAASSKTSDSNSTPSETTPSNSTPSATAENASENSFSVSTHDTDRESREQTASSNNVDNVAFSDQNGHSSTSAGTETNGNVAFSDQNGHSSTSAGTETNGNDNTDQEMDSNSNSGVGAEDKGKTSSDNESGDDKQNESVNNSESSKTEDNAGSTQQDPVDSADSSIPQDEKDARTDLGTLPEMKTEGTDSGDVVAK